MRSVISRIALIVVVGLGLMISLSSQALQAASSVTVYDEALASGWENWSWNTTVNFAATGTVHGGQRSLAATFDAGWGGLYLHRTQALPAGLQTLRFWIRGTGRAIAVHFYDQGSSSMASTEITPPSGTWKQFEISLAALGSSANVWGVVWQDATGAAQPQFFLDDIQLIGDGIVPTITPTSPPGTGPALQIDTAANQHPISSYIYGMNFADATLAAEIRLPVNRWGGNSTTRYNWQNDTSNQGSDWYFENVPHDNDNPNALPNGSDTDRFIAANKSANVATLLTIPLIGWTPRARDLSCGFSIQKYGAQQGNDWEWRPDCGNGVRTNGSLITGNDPTETSIAIGPSFVQDWLRHLIAQFGTADLGGVRFYNLDNEPALWNSTHRDVFPQGLSYDGLRDRTYQYAAAIKAVDPGALTLGPVEWGWTNYFYSARDAEPGGRWWENPLDRQAHGNLELTAWYLQQMRLYEQQHGVRILDYLDLHFYPQADDVALSPAGDAAIQALRLRLTRGLWDATYLDESWINDYVRMIPRMKDWVNTYYPGTKLAITEYNFGGVEHINGALAQADVLGIFGREGLDLATMWGPPEPDQPAAYAFRIYRNYDGAGGAFGETSVRATSADQGKLAVYAALRGDGALTVVVINKTGGALRSPLTITGFTSEAAAVYRYSAANLNRIVHESDLTITNGRVTAEFPANSITLLVLGASTPARC